MKLKANKLAALALAAGLLAGMVPLSVSAAEPAATAPAAAAAVEEAEEATNGLLSRIWPFKKVPATEILLGEYQSTMTVGSTQRLSPTVLPENTTDTTLSIFSENNNIVAVNEQGYIGAVAVGTTRVGVTCGSITAYYTITVEPDPSTIVTDMDISLSASELHVGDTATLSISVMPSTAASSADIAFTSSNEAVATVNAFGRITAVSVGKATISVQCGDVVRSVTVTVSAKTDGITVDSSYLVLKPGATHTIKAKVTPASAPQALTYTSLDSKVATVTASGVVQGVSTGSTSILVSNGSTKAVVSVIVNQSASSSGDSQEPSPSDPVQPVDTSQLVQEIQDTAEGQEILADLADVPVVTSDVLNALHGTKKSLVLSGEAYRLVLTGASIKNASNELHTQLAFQETAEGLEFTVNGGGYMPGQIQIELSDELANTYRCLYLYNASLDEWQQLNSYKNGVLTLDTAGRYLLTVKAFTLWGLNWWMIGGAAVVVAALIVAYIIVKRRYWFW